MTSTKYDRLLVKAIVLNWLTIECRNRGTAAFGDNAIKLGYTPLFFGRLKKAMVKELTPVYLSGEWPEDHCELLDAVCTRLMRKYHWEWPPTDKHTPGVCPHCQSDLSVIDSTQTIGNNRTILYKCNDCNERWTETWIYSRTTKL